MIQPGHAHRQIGINMGSQMEYCISYSRILTEEDIFQERRVGIVGWHLDFRDVTR